MIFFYVGITNIVLVFFNVIFVTLLLQMNISVHNLKTQGVSVHAGIPVCACDICKDSFTERDNLKKQFMKERIYL